MLNVSSFKKLSQATASAALGVAMLTTFGTASASAVTLQTFNFSGNFVSEANVNSTGLSVDLEDGSFAGTYTVDVEKLSSTAEIALEDWNISLSNASGNVLKTLSSSLTDNFGVLKDGILTFSEFIATGSTPNVTTSYFTLSADFGDSFNGTGTGSGQFYNITSSGNVLTSAGRIVIQPSKSEPVPEPLTLGGTAVAGTIGLWMKRKQKNSQAA